MSKTAPRTQSAVLTRKGIQSSLVSVAGIIGRPVKDQDGKDLGKLLDFVVRHGGETYPPVSGLIVKVAGRRAYIDGARIAKLTKDEITLSSAKVNLNEYQRRSGEQLLDGDVLDHQIVDVNGLRVVRTSDLYLAPLDKEIRLVGVDVSFRSFVRRIFPGTFGRKPGVDQVIDWASVASLADDGGVVRTTATREALSKLRPADIADIIEDLEGREQSALIELLDPDLAADALEEMEDDELQGLLRGISDERAAELLSHMEPDESAEVLRDLDEEHSESILAQMAPAMAKQLRRLVEFDETHAGGIMTTHLLIVKESDTVSDALKLLVEHRERDISDGVTVVDSKGKLLDHIQIIELIAAKPSEKLETLVKAPFPTAVGIDTPLEDVIEEFSNNRGSSVIVVDEKGKPVGRILADDIIDAMVPAESSGLAQGSGALS
ncbi:MAG: CBS domain-containing protein [Actinomycetales bacterium]|nr:CBS domain-containing protein [Actinomycetales bacterium]